MSDEPVDLNGDEENDSDDVDWENRKLCSDESCIGVIGADGRCKECGRHHEPQQVEAEENNATLSDNQQIDEPSGVAPPASDSDDDWENRTLCSDESCIGVIGPDGRCKECGKPYTG
jgi:hypothetical protein